MTLPKRRFSCLYRAGHLAPGETLCAVGDPSVKVHLYRNGESREALCEVEFEGEEPVIEILDRIGQLPLPPYIVKQRKTHAMPNTRRQMRRLIRRSMRRVGVRLLRRRLGSILRPSSSPNSSRVA